MSDAATPLGLFYRDRDPVSGKVEVHKADLAAADYFHHGAKPIVIMIPGYTVTQDDNPRVVERNISGHIKCVEKLLGDSDQAASTNVFCCAFSKRAPDAHRFQYATDHIDNFTGTTPSDEEHFLHNILLPIAGVDEGEHPNADEICQRLSRLTLISHSSGCRVAQTIGRLFIAELAKQGYTAEETARIAHEVVNISFASFVPLEEKGANFRTVSFAGQVDRRIWYMLRNHGLEDIAEGHAVMKQHYMDSGYDYDTLERRIHRLESTPYSPRVTKFERKDRSNGLAYYIDVPNQLSWEYEGHTHTESAQVPEHALSMFVFKGKTEHGQNGNTQLVQKVAGTLGNAVQRNISNPAQWREELLGMSSHLPEHMQQSRSFT